MRIVSIGFAILLMALGNGCSSKPVSESGGAPKSVSLFEVGGLLSAYSNETKKAPSKVSDLAKYENGFPSGYQAVKSGDIVVLWGVKMIIEEGNANSGSAEIIAYEKAAPTEGGHVLFLNGAIKSMTADEFKSAPKAGKK